MEYTYDQMFQRNIGIFTPEDQERIKNLKVAIAGAGGLGGSLAYLLVRLGIQNIKICDPEEFEISNINRQFGCYVDTIGENKAKAVARELLRINPKINIEAWDYGIDNDNAGKFVEGCDVVIDGIDFYAIPASLALQKSARQQNKWVMTSQCAGSMASYLYMAPDGPNFSDLFFENGILSMPKIIKTLFPVLPHEATTEMLSMVERGEEVDIPGWSFVMIGVYILFDDLVKHFIKNEKDLIASPTVLLFDTYNRKFITQNV